jgi:hypothetical protein
MTDTDRCPLCRAMHAGISCHFADTDATPLLLAGIDKACTAKALAREIGTTEETLSRSKRRARKAVPAHRKPRLALGLQIRFDLVQYLIGAPVRPPPPTPGWRPQFAPKSIKVWLDERTHRLLTAIAATPAEQSPVVMAALDRWCSKYAVRPRGEWPAYAAKVGAYEHNVPADREIVMRFDLAIGGPGWRRFYAPIAIEEYLAEMGGVAAA